jgi:hypothetical protein
VPLAVVTWVQVLASTATVAVLVANVWEDLHPIVIPGSDTTFVVDDQLSGVRPLLLFLLMLCMLASIPLAAVTVGLAFAAVGERRRHRLRLAAFSVTAIALMAAQWWWNVDHSAEDGSPGASGPPYYLFGAGLLLALGAALVLQLHLSLREVAVAIVRPSPRPVVPAGWYPDPAASAGWRWWDGTAWAAADQRGIPTASP